MQVLENHMNNFMHKKKLQAFFDLLRNEAHKNRLEKLASEEAAFRSELEAKILI